MVQDVVASREGRGYAVLTSGISKVGKGMVQRTEQHGYAVLGKGGGRRQEGKRFQQYGY